MLQIVLILAGLVLLYMVIIVLKDLKGGLVKRKLPNMSIDFTDLSSIWMKYNNNVEKINTPDETGVIQLFEDDEKKPNELTTDTATTDIQNDEDTEEREEKDDTTKKDSIITLPENQKIFSSFIENCINPYKHVIKEQGVATVIQKLVDILEQHGHCPPVVIDNNDNESAELISVRETLSQVSLREHTYFVCNKLIGIVKENQKDYEQMIPNAIVTALAHDIGKIPEFRESRLYNTSEHALISANKLNEFFVGTDVFWKEKTITAIKEHHIQTDKDWSIYLKQADKKAREVELQRFTSQYEIKPFESWFNVDVFLKKIETYINIEQASQKWQAFSCKGIVYCKPDLLYNVAKEMCKEAKALDLSFVYESEKENVKRMVVNALRECYLIPDLLGHGKYCRKFEIKTKTGMAKKMEFMLTPIKADKYDISQIEERKQGFSEIISEVIPK